MSRLTGRIRDAALATALALAFAATAGGAPLPPRRPIEPAPPVAVPSAPAARQDGPKPDVPTPALPAQPRPVTPSPPPGECLRRLVALGIVAEVAAIPAGACAVEEPVRITSLPAAPGRTIALPDRPVVACRFVEPFATWATRIAAPLLGSARGTPLASIRTGPGFECRGRNRQVGAKMSAHGSGLALDVASFEFADGSRLGVRPPDPPDSPDQAFAAIRQAACGWFTTVLGPGSDPFHSDHLHLDIQQHGASERYRICQ